MNITSTVVTTVINRLRNASALANRTIVPEFDSNTAAMGISSPVIAVGVNEFTADDTIYMRNSDGSNVSQGKRNYELTVRIRFYVPFSSGAQPAYGLSDAVFDALTGSGFQYHISSVQVKNAVFDSQTEALVVDTFYKVNGTVNS